MFLIISFLFLFYSCKCNVKQYEITGRIDGYDQGMVYMAESHGEQPLVMDSARITDRRFSLMVGEEVQAGLYRFFLHPEDPYAKSFYIVCNREDISFSTNYNQLTDSMLISTSVENKNLYEFLVHENTYQQRLNIILSVLDNYPNENNYYQTTVSEFEKIQKERKALIESLIRKNPDLYSTRYIRSYLLPLIPSGLNREERSDYLKEHFFDEVDFTDSLLLRSNAFNRLAIEYLSLFRIPGMDRESQAKMFTQAVDNILLHAYVSPAVYEYLVAYLVDGFEQFQMESVVYHIARKNLENIQCQPTRNDILETRLKSYLSLRTGAMLPDYSFTAKSGNEVSFSSTRKPFTLLLFWASWCPHCKQLIMQLDRLYEQQYQNVLRVLSVSLDTSSVAYNTAALGINRNWVFYCDYKGWESDIVNKHYVYATPTMILFDKKRIILAKPFSLRELDSALREAMNLQKTGIPQK
jgi:thiol-disulfide isomerase/thioredoxin